MSAPVKPSTAWRRALTASRMAAHHVTHIMDAQNAAARRKVEAMQKSDRVKAQYQKNLRSGMEEYKNVKKLLWETKKVMTKMRSQNPPPARKRDARKWSVEQVADWFTVVLELPAHAASIYDCDVNGKRLLAATDDTLQDWGIEQKLHRRKIMQRVDILQAVVKQITDKKAKRIAKKKAATARRKKKQQAATAAAGGGKAAEHPGSDDGSDSSGMEAPGMQHQHGQGHAATAPAVAGRLSAQTQQQLAEAEARRWKEEQDKRYAELEAQYAEEEKAWQAELQREEAKVQEEAAKLQEEQRLAQLAAQHAERARRSRIAHEQHLKSRTNLAAAKRQVAQQRAALEATLSAEAEAAKKALEESKQVELDMEHSVTVTPMVAAGHSSSYADAATEEEDAVVEAPPMSPNKPVDAQPVIPPVSSLFDAWAQEDSKDAGGVSVVPAASLDASTPVPLASPDRWAAVQHDTSTSIDGPGNNPLAGSSFGQPGSNNAGVYGQPGRIAGYGQPVGSAEYGQAAGGAGNGYGQPSNNSGYGQASGVPQQPAAANWRPDDMSHVDLTTGVDPWATPDAATTTTAATAATAVNPRYTPPTMEPMRSPEAPQRVSSPRGRSLAQSFINEATPERASRRERFRTTKAAVIATTRLSKKKPSLTQRFREQEREKHMQFLEEYIAKLSHMKAEQQIRAERDMHSSNDPFVTSSLKSSRTSTQGLMAKNKDLQELRTLAKRVDRIRALPAWPERLLLEEAIDRLSEDVHFHAGATPRR